METTSLVLIPIAEGVIGNATVQTVNARDLHAFLESKQQFADWIKNRVEQYEFTEEADFTVHKIMNGRATLTEYHLSLDTAKELAMVERNEKGKQARRYFIECERRLHEAPVQPQIPTSLSQALRLAAEQAEIIERQDEALLLAGPKVAALELLSNSDGSMCMTEAAKILGIPPRKLILWMQQNGWIFRRGDRNEVYQDRIKQGLMEETVITYTSKSTGEERVKPNPRVLPKGLAKLAEIFAQKEAA